MAFGKSAPKQMSETYQIITDEKALRAFIDSLPDLKEGEKFYGCLFARKKYWPGIDADKSQVKRFLFTKERALDKIRQLECKIGAYTFNGKEIPNDALALYVMPNPRDMVRATSVMIGNLAELLAFRTRSFNPHQEALTAMQKCKARSIYRDYDFDMETLPDLTDVLNPDSYRVLKTRGGFHVLVESDKVEEKYKKTFHLALDKLGADVSGDCLLPAPGCNQGGFTPYFV